MNEPHEKAFFNLLMVGTSFFFVLGLTIVATFFTGHYLDLALPVVKKIYGTQESVPVAYDRGLNLCIISAFAVASGLASMLLLKMKKRSKSTLGTTTTNPTNEA